MTRTIKIFLFAVVCASFAVTLTHAATKEEKRLEKRLIKQMKEPGQTNPWSYRTYVQKYPTGRHVKLAQERLLELCGTSKEWPEPERAPIDFTITNYSATTEHPKQLEETRQGESYLYLDLQLQIVAPKSPSCWDVFVREDDYDFSGIPGFVAFYRVREGMAAIEFSSQTGKYIGRSEPQMYYHTSVRNRFGGRFRDQTAMVSLVVVSSADVASLASAPVVVRTVRKLVPES